MKRSCTTKATDTKSPNTTASRERIFTERRGVALRVEQLPQRERAEADAALLEEPAERDEPRVAAAKEMGLAVHDS